MASQLEIVIRDAQATDLPEIVRIYNDSIPAGLSTADTEPVSVESRRAWFAGLGAAQGRPIWIALDRGTGRMVGWACLPAWKERCAYGVTREISVYVDSPAHGRGVASRLVERALAECPRIGVDRLIGVIYAHNQPSLRLFAKHGFREWGHLPGVTVHKGVRRDVKIVGREV